MSVILMKNRCFIGNLRKSFLYLSPRYSSVRVTNPRVHLIARHQRCFANLAFKHKENGNYAENSENLGDLNSAPASIESAMFNLDESAKRTGRVPHPLVERAFSLAIKSGQPITSVQSLYLLRSCGLMLREKPETRVKLADEVWRELEKLGCNFDIRHYNSLLKIYVDSDHQFTPSDFLVRLESNNVEPNRVTLLYMIEKYCNDGNLNGASEILQYLKEKGFSVNENVFSALITGHMRINDVSGAMEIFDVMRSSNLIPSTQSYVALACGHGWNGNIEGVKSTIQEAEKNGVSFLSEDYLSILSSFLTDDHLPYVDEIINVIGNDILILKQSALNTTFGLINKGACETAYRLILSISKDEESARLNTNVFINYISKTNQPLEKMVRFLEDITEKNLNPLAWLNCAKSCIDVEEFDKAFIIFEEMTKRGYPVRTHHIWPIFPKLKSEKEIFSTLKRMFDLGLPADYTTFAKYVFPAIDVSNPERVFRKIEETGQTRTGAYEALFIYYTQNGQSSNAMHVAKNYPVFVPSEFDLKKFLSSHSENEMRDIYSPFHEVLAFVIKNIGGNLRLQGGVEGETLANLILLNPSAFLFWVRRAKEEGFQLSLRSYDVCCNILSRKNPQLLNHAYKLEALSINRQSRNLVPKAATIQEEDKEIQRLGEKGQRTDVLMQQLLQQHVRNKNLDRVDHLKHELEKSNVKLTPVTLYSLFHFHKQQGDVQEAEKYLRTLNENYPGFEIDTAQILEFATLLIKYSRFDDAMDLLKSNCKVIRINGSKDFLYRATRKFFDCALESGNTDFLRNAQSHLLTVFTDRLYRKMLYEPLVKMHLFRNNLDDAVKEFKSLVHDKKVAPYSTQLMKKCIMSDDHKTLESVIETASTLDGKIPVLQELSLAFLELGRKDQAAQVLENLGRKMQSSFLLNTCSKFLADRSVSKLEDFLFVLKKVDGVDLPKGFSFLFKLYDLENDANKALSTYKEIKDINLDDSTKRLLINLLERSNVAVPSHLREPISSEKTNVKEDIEVTGKPSDPIMKEFLEVLEKADTALALEKLDSMKKGHIRSLSLNDMTRLVDLIVEKRLGQDLSRNVLAMSYIIENANEILKSLLTKYSEAGDVESLHHIANFMPDFSLRSVSFNTFFCNAYLASGKHAELLLEMENRYDKKNKMFSAKAFMELLNNPDLKERAINLAEQYSQIKFYTPMTMVWAHYLISENYDAADKIEENNLVEGEKADSIILRAVRKSENPTLGRKYVDNLNKYNCRLRHKERAYGALLDVLVLKERYDEAVSLVAESKEKRVDLEKHFRSTLVTLKAALERENKPVPFAIPSEESIIHG